MIASFDIGEKNFAFCVGTPDRIDRFALHDVMKKRCQTIAESCDAISKILETEDWKDCEKVIIENQMIKNVRAQRIAQHVWSWFRIVYPRLSPEFVSSTLKTKHFLGQNSLGPKERKKWAVEKFSQLLNTVATPILVSRFEQLRKKDDVSDTFLQLVAYSKKFEKKIGSRSFQSL